MIDLSRQRELSKRKMGRLSEFVADRNIGKSEEQGAAFALELHAMLVQAIFSAEYDFSVCARRQFPKRPAGDSVAEACLLMKSLLFWILTLTPEDGRELVNVRFTWS